MHHDYDRVKSSLDRCGKPTPAHDEVAYFILKPKDTSWDPVHEGERLHGPGTVEYRRHPDGGITAIEHGLANSGAQR